MFSIPKINLGKISSFKVGGIPWWLILLVFGWVYYSAYERGKMHEELKAIQHKIDSSNVIISGLKDSIHLKDSVVLALLTKIEKAKVKVITVDNTVQPQIDSSIAALEKNLDSANLARLKIIVGGFEARIEARDSLISYQSKVIVAQDSSIKSRDKLIAIQESVNEDLQKAYKEKRTGLTLPQKIAGVVLAGLVIFSLAK